MNLLDRILSVQNFNEAIKEVAQNKGAPGIDGMTVDELQGYFAVHGDEIRTQIRYKQYRPQPVRRVYIPKPNSDKLSSDPAGGLKDTHTGIRPVFQRPQLRIPATPGWPSGHEGGAGIPERRPHMGSGFRHRKVF